MKKAIGNPTKQAVASVAIVSLLSAVENSRKARKELGAEDFSKQDMSGELQTIPARHGVATFVPRGRTIKIINTYGKQVVSTWAFSLNKPPEEEDRKRQAGEVIEEGPEQLGEEVKQAAQKAEEEEETGAGEAEQSNQEAREADDPPEEEIPGQTQDGAKKGTVQEGGNKAEKKTWSSYLPSIPYRSKAAAKEKPSPEAEKAEAEADSRKWSSYLPTGKGFSSYVPNMQLPDSKRVISAFQATHPRDPNKSYAEQLYDFSKTPVGAGGIAAATGSGTASSIYAAYNAYTKMVPSGVDVPPMEFLSLSHTCASSHHLVPLPEDTLLSNLRAPIMTLVEDSTLGAHDTLTAACDATLYDALGVDKPEEHGSCAENLVLALKELNEKAGLKGNRAVGADVTVNFAPQPLHLFMNASIHEDESTKQDGSGARGLTFSVEEPKGKKREFVRFKAERDIVVVMSACPMDVGKQNGGKCMAANFVVEEDEEKSKEKVAPSKGTPEKKGTPMPKPKGGPAKFAKKSDVREERAEDKAPTQKKVPEQKAPVADTTNTDLGTIESSPKPKKKPKKLEKRGSGVIPSSKSEFS